MAFRKGQSGNPAGRPKGSKDKRTALRELLRPHADRLVAKAVELALKGDTTALRMCLDRLIAPIKANDASITLEALTGTLTDKGERIIAEIASGNLSPDQGAAMLAALASQTRIIEVDDLSRRVAALEAKNGSQTAG